MKYGTGVSIDSGLDSEDRFKDPRKRRFSASYDNDQWSIIEGSGVAENNEIYFSVKRNYFSNGQGDIDKHKVEEFTQLLNKKLGNGYIRPSLAGNRNPIFYASGLELSDLANMLSENINTSNLVESKPLSSNQFARLKRRNMPAAGQYLTTAGELDLYLDRAA